MSSTDKNHKDDSRMGPEKTPGARKKANNSQPLSSSRRDFLMMSTAAGASVFLVGKALAQDPAPAAAAPAPEAAAAAPAPEAAAAAAPAPPAAAAAIAAAPPASPVPAVLASGKKLEDINIAIVGLGAEGQVLLDSILRIPGIRIKAVCDIWQYSLKRGAGMAKTHGHDVKSYTDFDEMLATEKDNIDAVVVATPDFMHHVHTIASLRAGKHVYCEKEMSNTLEHAREMVAAARETGKLLQIGHQRRSNPRYIHAIKTMIHENKLIGRVTHAYGQWNRAKSEDLGWPKKYEISADILEKYGYDSMQHFRNWRWYKKYGGGPIVDLGSHQIDIFAWVYGVNPKSVMAGGGIDFYKSHEWYDNVLATFEYENEYGVNRAFYQVLTTTSNGGFYENFMGEDGTLVISEVPPRGNHFLRESHAPEWEPFVDRGLLEKPAQPAAAAGAQKLKNAALDVRVSAALGSWPLPIQFLKPPHQAHLENFFNAMWNGSELSCPAQIGYETAVAVLKVNQAVEAGVKLAYTPEEFKA
jgi:predicted dehydrogenase